MHLHVELSYQCGTILAILKIADSLWNSLERVTHSLSSFARRDESILFFFIFSFASVGYALIVLGCSGNLRNKGECKIMHNNKTNNSNSNNNSNSSGNNNNINTTATTNQNSFSGPQVQVQVCTHHACCTCDLHVSVCVCVLALDPSLCWQRRSLCPIMFAWPNWSIYCTNKKRIICQTDCKQASCFCLLLLFLLLL